MRLQPLLLGIEKQEAQWLKPELILWQLGAVWLKPYPDTDRQCIGAAG
jgi:hypothetical protein